MIEILSRKLNENGIPNEVVFRGSVIRQIQFTEGDVMEGFGIEKLETSGFGYGIVNGLDVDEAYRLITGVSNPNWAENFRWDMPAGALVSDRIIYKKLEDTSPIFFNERALQLGEVHDYAMNAKTGKNEPQYPTFVKVKFDTWKWCGFCFKGVVNE